MKTSQIQHTKSTSHKKKKKKGKLGFITIKSSALQISLSTGRKNKPQIERKFFQISWLTAVSYLDLSK